MNTKTKTNTALLAKRLLSGKKVPRKCLKTPVSTPKKLILTKYICENCGVKIDAPKDSICQHCGCRMSIYKKWMDKKI